MKAKKMSIIGTAIFAALLILAPMSSFAQTISATVNVVAVTQAANNLVLTASEVGGGFTNSTFVIQNSNTQKNALLAIILTAKSTSAPVEIFFNQANNVVSAAGISQ